MKKALYIILLAVETLSLFLPLYFVLYFHGVLVSFITFLAFIAIYAFFVIRAVKQKKAGDEAGLKKTRIFAALVSPVIWVAFVGYFYYICAALGVI